MEAKENKKYQDSTTVDEQEEDKDETLGYDVSKHLILKRFTGMPLLFLISSDALLIIYCLLGYSSL